MTELIKFNLISVSVGKSSVCVVIFVRKSAKDKITAQIYKPGSRMSLCSPYKPIITVVVLKPVECQ